MLACIYFSLILKVLSVYAIKYDFSIKTLKSHSFNTTIGRYPKDTTPTIDKEAQIYYFVLIPS